MEKCMAGSWIFATSPFNVSFIWLSFHHDLAVILFQAGQSVTGQVLEILAESGGKHAVVVLDLFHILSSRHEIFGMPMLARRHGEAISVVIPSTVSKHPLFLIWSRSSIIWKDIEFIYNVQHDCPFARCTSSGKEPVIQERVASDLMKSCVEHNPIERFVINTHAFHNAHRLQAALDRSLTAPIPLYPPGMRKAKHFEMAKNLRVAQKARVEARAVPKNRETDTPGSVIPTKRMRLDTWP